MIDRHIWRKATFTEASRQFPESPFTLPKTHPRILRGCVFDNFPDIGDTRITMELCRSVGSDVNLSQSVLKIKRVIN